MATVPGRTTPSPWTRRPLLPGQTATFARYSAYRRGINGLQVDIAGSMGPFFRQR